MTVVLMPYLWLRSRYWMLLPAAAGVALGVLRVWEPTDDPATSICLFRRCTGYSCPGCGMTRAVAHLVKGNWERMFFYHPLAPLILMQLVIGGAVWVAGRAGWLAVRPGRWVEWMAVANLVLLLGVWLLRFATGTLPPG